jgi:quinoprotein relay system zinc metallohydrolase 2
MRYRPVHLLVLLLLGLPPPAAAGSAPLALTEVAPGLFVRSGVQEEATSANADAIANAGFVVGAAAVAVIDPGGSLEDGRRLRDAVIARTDRPIAYVVMSHSHPDHVFGAGAFAGDHPQVVGHARLPGALAERGEYYRSRLAALLGPERTGPVVPPTLLVEQTLDVDLGDRVLTLTAHGTAHTDHDLSILDRKSGTLWAADLLFVDRIPVIDGSARGWLLEIERMKAMPATRAVPGHGPPAVPWPAAAADQGRYLATVMTEIRQLQARHGSIETAVREVGLGERGRWLLFDAYHGRNVTAAFKELEWE